MASISIENGKRIEELLEVREISSDAYFLVSETALARKISFLNIRNLINGDNTTKDKNNLYYSVEKIDQLLRNINNDIDKANQRIDNLSQQISNIQNELSLDISDLNNRVSQIYAELLHADELIHERITSVDNRLTAAINKEIADRIADVDAEEEARKQAVAAEAKTRGDADNAINKRIDDLITVDGTQHGNLGQWLKNLLDAEASTRANADATLTANLNTEITNRTNADAAEAEARKNADEAEKVAREQADNSLAQMITALITYTPRNGQASAHASLGQDLYNLIMDLGDAVARLQDLNSYKIVVGTNVPTPQDLDPGTIYLQYF